MLRSRLAGTAKKIIGAIYSSAVSGLEVAPRADRRTRERSNALAGQWRCSLRRRCCWPLQWFPLQRLQRRRGVLVGLKGVTLGNTLVVYEEEGEEHEVSRGEGDPRYHVDRLGHPDRVWWFLLSHLFRQIM